MVRIPVLCPHRHSDHIMKCGTTKAATQRYSAKTPIVPAMHFSMISPTKAAALTTGVRLGTPAPRPAQRSCHKPCTGRKQGTLPQALRRLQTLLARGFVESADVCPDRRRAYHWVHHTAHILCHEAQRKATAIRRR
jgi:hypothetical protein